jgi:hypothetical protein
MQPGTVVIDSPFFGFLSHFFERFEHVAVQQLFSDIAIATFYIPILHRLPSLDKEQLDLVLLTPDIQLAGDKFRPIVDSYYLRQSPELF